MINFVRHFCEKFTCLTRFVFIFLFSDKLPCLIQFPIRASSHEKAAVVLAKDRQKTELGKFKNDQKYFAK